MRAEADPSRSISPCSRHIIRIVHRIKNQHHHRLEEDGAVWVTKWPHARVAHHFYSIHPMSVFFSRRDGERHGEVDIALSRMEERQG